ncbi:bifunctional 4-hydroxy-2-oxoglutarate aldolase/2-dehydro-3-deoxy-phosphogluconate aldolase [Phormidesmis sp. 146-35]
MKADSWLAKLRAHRAIAVIRAPTLNLGREMAKAVALGGMKLIEITWDSDRPAQLIHELRNELSDCTIGTGTVFTLHQLQLAIEAGAEFVFTPHVNLHLIERAIEQEIPMIPGALTPTEIVMAWQAGASSVKVFPVQALGGSRYMQSLQAPLAHIPLIPTGGVSLDNAKELVAAGAIAVGLSGNLFPKWAVENQDWDAIVQQSKSLMQGLEDFRRGRREEGGGRREEG